MKASWMKARKTIYWVSRPKKKPHANSSTRWRQKETEPAKYWSITLGPEIFFSALYSVSDTKTQKHHIASSNDDSHTFASSTQVMQRFEDFPIQRKNRCRPKTDALWQSTSTSFQASEAGVTSFILRQACSHFSNYFSNSDNTYTNYLLKRCKTVSKRSKMSRKREPNQKQRLKTSETLKKRHLYVCVIHNQLIW